MSHQRGTVYIERDGQHVSVGYFEYNGTVDIAEPTIEPTMEALTERWRKRLWKECTCDGAPTPVWLVADYGGGIEWPSLACFTCMVLVGELDPFEAAGHNYLGDTMNERTAND